MREIGLERDLIGANLESARSCQIFAERGGRGR
jgi:hypothetical protein